MTARRKGRAPAAAAWTAWQQYAENEPMSPPYRFLDVGRLLMGSVPAMFLVEAVIRIAVVYAVLLLFMRLMGKRMASQTTRNEMAALVSLAAAIGPAVQAPERGLLPPLLIGGMVVAVQRLVALGTVRSATFERRTQGDVTIVIKDGALDLRALGKIALSRERIIGMLRARGIDHLGRVERAYFESNGSLSIIERSEPLPGLSLFPDWDGSMRDAQHRAPRRRACGICGRSREAGDAADRCDECGRIDWQPAVTSAS
jgi:hypothetical protein